MTEPNGNGGGSGGDDSWQRDNGMQYAPSRLEYSAPSSVPPAAAAALTGGNIYMMPTAQDVFLQASSHQMHQPPLHQQLHHPHLRTMPPTSYIQHPEYAPAARSDGYTVVQTPHGEYVFYNGSDAKSYNNYELFSGKSYVPHHVIEQPQQQPKEHFHHFHPAGGGHMNGQAASSSSDNNNTNFLNQLVGNMMPNMSGTYSPFGESPLPPQPIPLAAQSPSLMHISPPADILNANAPSSAELPAAVAGVHFSGIEQVKAVDGPPAGQVGGGQQSQRTNGSFVQDNIAAAEKKPRMVAEVRPMRMSYSDVLSKNVFINRKDSAESNGNASAANSAAGQTNGSSNPGAQQKSTKSKANHLSSDKKSSNHSSDDKDASGTAKSTSKSGPQINSSGTRNSSTDIDSDANRENRANDEGKGARKRLQNGNGSKNPVRAKSTQPDPAPKRRSDASVGNGLGGSQSAAKDDSAGGRDKSQPGSATNGSGSGYFYNITKNDLPSQADKAAASSTASKSYQYRKSVPASKGSSVPGRNGAGNTSRSEKSQQKRLQRSRDNTKYALTKRILNTWLDFLLRFVYWLVALVCDVIVLSSGILVDRVSAVFDYLRQSVASLRHEFLNSSGRPTTYFWSLLRSFDKRFNKESKWAFWRRLFAKKKPPEPTTDYYKNGRLPQTGEEAMYSLLNCKGKDAYR